MIDPDRLNALRGRFVTGEHSVPSRECLDADTVAALVDGTLEPAARAAAIQHVAACTLCRQAVASVAKALQEGPVTHEIAMLDRRARRTRWSLGVAIPLTAAALVLLLLRGRVDVPVHRGPSPPPALTPIPLSPVGEVATVERIVWTHVDGADQYRLTLFDSRGRVLYSTAVADTAAALPTAVTLAPHQTYLWKVDARTGFDRWVGSELVRFSMADTAP